MSSNLLSRTRLLSTATPLIATTCRPQYSALRRLHTTPSRLASEGSRPVQGGPARRNDQLSFFPFFGIFVIGSAFFAWTVKSREGVIVKPKNQEPLPIEESPHKRKSN